MREESRSLSRGYCSLTHLCRCTLDGRWLWNRNWGRHFSNESLDAHGNGYEVVKEPHTWGSVPRAHRKACFDEVLVAAHARTERAAAAGRRMLFFTSPFTGFHGSHFYSVESLQRSSFGESLQQHIVWASLNFRRTLFRRQDVSLPSLPLAAVHPALARGTPAAVGVSDTNVKRYLLSFIGSQRNKVKERELVYRQFHNLTARGVLVVDHKNDVDVMRNLRNAYGSDLYNRVLSLSRFSLVLRGDRPRSFRYAEVMCSGSVPVFIDDFTKPQDLWEIPFGQLAPADTYSLTFALDKLPFLLEQLERISPDEYERLRASAAAACYKHMSSIDRVVDTTLAIAFGGADAATL